MSVQRYIDTGFWDDDWIASLKASEKLLYIYLLTNPLTNIAGIYKTTMRRMVFDTGIQEADIEAALSGFSVDGKAFYREGYMILPNWPKHQRWEDRPSIRKGIDRVLDGLSASMLTTLSIVGYAYLTPKIRPSTTPPPGGAPQELPIYQEEPSYSDSDSDTDTDTDTDGVSRGAPIDPRRRELDRALAGIKAVFESGEGKDEEAGTW